MEKCPEIVHYIFIFIKEINIHFSIHLFILNNQIIDLFSFLHLNKYIIHIFNI